MNDLENARNLINEVDKEIMQLFEKRMDAVKKVLDYKKENNLPILDKDREKIVIEKNTSYVSNELKPYAQRLVEALMDISKDYQNRG